MQSSLSANEGPEKAAALSTESPPFGEGKHRARLYAMHSFGALPRTPLSTQVSYRSPRRQWLGSLTTLRLLSKQNPLRSRWQLCCLTDAAYPLRVLCWAFVWLRRRTEGGTNCEDKEVGNHHPAGDTSYQGDYSGACQSRWLTVTDYLCYSGLAKEIVRVEGLEQVLSELKAQGRNLNQLTTLANMGKVTVLKGDALAENYGKIYEQLRELLREVT